MPRVAPKAGALEHLVIGRTDSGPAIACRSLCKATTPVRAPSPRLVWRTLAIAINPLPELAADS